MNWRLFVGAAILTVGLLLKLGAPPLAIVMGLALAALLRWLTRHRNGQSAGSSR